MKRILSLSLVLCLILCFSPSAFAVSPQFDLTKEITDTLDEEHVRYTLAGLTEDGAEEFLYVTYTGDYLDTIEVDIFVSEEYDSVQMYCFAYVEYNPSDYINILHAVNQMNKEYNYVKFFCDEDSNTVSACYDGFLIDGVAGALAYEMLGSIVTIADEAYNDIFYRYAI